MRFLRILVYMIGVAVGVQACESANLEEEYPPAPQSPDDNDTTGRTDTLSYALDIAPILADQAHGCTNVGCHGQGSASSGVSLESYDGVRAAAQNDRLYNSVARNGLTTAMPFNPDDALEAGDVLLIRQWTDQDFPE